MDGTLTANSNTFWVLSLHLALLLNVTEAYWAFEILTGSKVIYCLLNFRKTLNLNSFEESLKEWLCCKLFLFQFAIHCSLKVKNLYHSLIKQHFQKPKTSFCCMYSKRPVSGVLINVLSLWGGTMTTMTTLTKGRI